MSEIADAVQIIRVTYDGIEIAMKMGSASIHSMQKALDLIVGLLEHEKEMGKTNLKGLLAKGGDIQVLSFADEDLKKFRKLAKKYGILYSEIAQENEHAVKTRVPGMYGQNEGYIWIDKADIMEIHNGKTLLTYLDKNKEYKIYSADNRVLRTIKGEELYSGHYDRVEAAVRQRYKAAKPQPAKTVERTRRR